MVNKGRNMLLEFEKKMKEIDIYYNWKKNEKLVMCLNTVGVVFAKFFLSKASILHFMVNNN